MGRECRFSRQARRRQILHGVLAALGLVLGTLMYGLGLWTTRDWVNWRSARVTVGRDGIGLERLSGRTFLRWEDGPSLQWPEGSGVLLSTFRRGLDEVPGRLGNVHAFVELVRKRSEKR